MEILKKNINFNFFGRNINMVIFDYFKAKERNIKDINYDIISKCLESENNCWEPYQTEITKEILKDGNNIFIDIGTHIGYYSLIALSLGNYVIGIDCNETFLSFYRENINLNNFKNINIVKTKVDCNFNIESIVDIKKKIKLIKCDIEGFEIEFIRSIEGLLENKIIENLILEISPKKRNEYNEIIELLFKKGYYIYDIGLSPQRKLDEKINLDTLQNKNINLDKIDINKYLCSLDYNQSNFLFTLKKY